MKTRFQINLDMSGAAFDHNAPAALASTLCNVARALLEGRMSGPVRDPNGRTVGAYHLDHDASEAELTALYEASEAPVQHCARKRPEPCPDAALPACASPSAY